MRRRLIVSIAIACALSLRAMDLFAADPLTLREAISRALAYAPAAEIAKAQTDFADAKVREARAPLFPSIAANGEYNQAPGYDQVISNRGLTLAQIGLDYTVLDGGRRTAQLKAARYAEDAAKLGFDATRAQITFATSIAYFNLLLTRGVVEQLQGSLKRLSQYVAIVETLRRSGRAIANDVLKIRSARDSTELALAGAKQAAEQAGILLAALVGEPGHSDIAIAGVSDLPAMPDGQIANSPVFRAAQRQVDAAAMAVAAARAESAPTFKLALTSGWEGIDPPKTFGHHLGASYDGMVTVPLFEGGLIHAHIDQAKAERQVAVAQARQIQIDLQRQLADAKVRYQAAREQLAIIHSSQATADDAFALAWTRFLGGGKITLLEVMDAYQQAQTLKTARLDYSFASEQASTEAILLLGVER